MPETQHDFNRALDFLKGGYWARRTDWEQGDMIHLDLDVLEFVDPKGNDRPFSAEDVLAEDWEIIPLDFMPPE